MKKTLSLLFIFAIFALNFTALDDITTGNEPDFVGEYLTLAASPAVLGGVLVLQRKK